jgi:uncharacterized protein YdaU (DUF1376 family)
MSKGFPYVPLYWGDFLRSTAGWTFTERAAYLMLLCTQWETGALPNDLGRLAAIIGIEQPEMSALWPLLSTKFKNTRAGLVNRRMEEHRRSYLEFRRRQSEGGRKGASARWKKPSNVVQFKAPDGDHE